jgi:hypothetical protein
LTAASGIGDIVGYRFITGMALLIALACPPLLAQTASDADSQRRLAEQKLKLVDMLVNSPKARAAGEGGDAETAALIGRGKQLLQQARDALSAQRYPEASQALDGALQNVSKANNRNAGELSESVQKQRLQEMSEQVASYRAALLELSKAKGAASTAQATLRQVDALAEEARKAAAAGLLGEANKKMAQACKLEVEEVSRLRAGQEVLMSLKFDTPADEYVYEQKRYESNQILVGMMIGEGRADGEKRRMVDGFLNEAVKLKDDAAGLARASRHAEAVAAMEKAGVQINRALQAMGVAVF